jgi:aspartyl-tRNA(Asn)/glutamyl-tRNA(Gln) amidotransferase subunit A
MTLEKLSPLFSDHRIGHLVSLFKNKDESIQEYLKNLFSYIEKYNPRLNALTSLQMEKALERAKELENKSPEEHETLYGVPIIIKENIQKKGFPVECASKILKGYKGQFDANAVELLEKAGAIVIATANMDEFAMGSSNEHSAHGPVKNPHDLSRVSGGSSGGSASSCAAGFAPVTLGSDTGGSVREPAAFCGIYGFKPSYGRVSRFGLVAYGSSLDQISPFARSAEDIDLVMQIIGREDARDATSLKGAYESQLNKVSIKGKKIGVIRSLLAQGVDDNVLQAFSDLEEKLKQQGAEFVDIDIKGLEHVLSVYYVIASAEASSNLSRFDGIRYGYRAESGESLYDLYCKTRGAGFGSEVKKRIMLGTFALSAGYYDAYYGKAQAVRQMISNEFEAAFSAIDFIYLPTAPANAFQLGETGQDLMKEYLYDIFTIPANLAGIPAISVPALQTQGLPVGLQFLARRGCDAELVAFAHALEKENLVGTTPLVWKESI